MNRFGKIVLILLVSVLLVVMVGPLLIPTPVRGSLSPRQLVDPDSRFIEVNGLEVHYKMAGQGEPVMILLHGFLASTYSWREVFLPLAERGMVIAFDRPAFGLTERPLSWEGSNPYAPEAQTDLVIGLMDALGIEQAILVGNSAGGSVSALTALRYPERVQALVLVDAAIYQGGGSPDWVKPLLATPQVRRLGLLFLGNLPSWGKEFGLSAWHDPAGFTEEIWEGYSKPLQVEGWDRALWELTLANRETGLQDRLAEIRQPTLVITGDDDRIVPTEQSIRLAGELPDARLVVIPACGHVPQEECPIAFLEAIGGFLDAEPWR